ncbi:hypothetical protein NDU88_000007 [Pleurodeles waltl]|uniref:Uncharacterized protein n=1 Tax=Pleurodeles waltl TaxID=8319 RepID=A0AAV7R4G6_PLEWA|nr:hypothetical protein NDU88_000007 [Pleurodeles waltl]
MSEPVKDTRWPLEDAGVSEERRSVEPQWWPHNKRGRYWARAGPGRVKEDRGGQNTLAGPDLVANKVDLDTEVWRQSNDELKEEPFYIVDMDHLLEMLNF